MSHAQYTLLLMVAHDGPGPGPLAGVVSSRQYFSCAILLAAEPGERALARADIRLVRHVVRKAPAGRAGQLAAGNVSARGIGLLQSIAHRRGGVLHLQTAP